MVVPVISADAGRQALAQGPWDLVPACRVLAVPRHMSIDHRSHVSIGVLRLRISIGLRRHTGRAVTGAYVTAPWGA